MKKRKEQQIVMLILLRDYKENDFMAEEKKEAEKNETAKEAKKEVKKVAEKKTDAEKTQEKKTEEKKLEKRKEAKEKTLPADVWNVLDHSLLTEKSISFVESQNKLVFIVRRNSSKKSIKWAIEKAFEAKVDEVRTLIDQKGRKKAFVKLDKSFNAGEIATRLGML